MLERLTVKNLAVVEHAEIAFGAGLNVITGETGSGKSVLMGAVELVLGARAEADVVRSGAKEAEIEAVFEGKTLRRTLTAAGRSRAWIDDESVTISELREFGVGLVDIHGPRANQELLEESFQRSTIDEFGSIDLSKYRQAYKELSQLNKRMEELLAGGGEDEADVLRFQIDELSAAKLSSDDEDLAERHAAAAHAEEITENANVVTEALGGDGSAAEILSSIQPRIAAISRHLPAASEWAQSVEDLTLRIHELSRSVADVVSRFDVPEEDLHSLDERVTLINKLERKYLKGGAKDVSRVEGLLGVLERKRNRLAEIENRDVAIEDLTLQINAAKEAAMKEARAISSLRADVSRRFAALVEKELKDLGFLRASFSVALEESEMSESGIDRVVYLFGPNPGESVRPLADIASSGEIARVMLAIKTVLSSRKGKAERASKTLVFDEIDANIGGEIGRTVGEKLSRLARCRQIIAITHLPQSAAYGESHFTVSKSVSDGRTRTEIKEVKGKARVAELARMMGGEGPTDAVKRHAQELAELSR
jgi:DNA repair protein RecN (Recombination protein N)